MYILQKDPAIAVGQIAAANEVPFRIIRVKFDVAREVLTVPERLSTT